MKIITISDTHTQHGFLELPKGDMIICAGDISYRGYRSEIENFLYWYNKLDYQYKILIAGNHDFYFENEDDDVDKLLSKYPTVTYLKDSGINIDGVNIWGTPWQPWFHNWAFNVPRGGLKPYWDLIPNNTDILITHTPPYKILDKIEEGDPVGCEELLERLNSLSVKYNIFGHIHEAYGIEKHNNTTYINTSVVNRIYNLVNKPILFEI